MNYYIKNIFFISMFFIPSLLFSNIGGRFYDHSITGVIPNDSISVVEANTFIHIIDSTCFFESVYKVNGSTQIFIGKFFGDGYSNIKVNGKSDSVINSLIDTLKGDSAVFGREFVLEEYHNHISYKSIPIRARIRSDSTFSISGILELNPGKSWGLAAIGDMASLRHPYLGNYIDEVNAHSIIYVFAPIHGFKRLELVTMEIEGPDIELISKKEIFKDRNQYHKYETNQSNSSIEYANEIPEAVQFYIARKDIEFDSKKLITAGGPIILFGKQNNKFLTELGWEFGINPTRYFSIMPSLNYSLFSKDKMSVAIRLFTLGGSIGIHTYEDKKREYSISLSYGVFGFELRAKTITLQLAI